MTTKIDIHQKRNDTRRVAFRITGDGCPVDISQWENFYMTIDTLRHPPDDSTKIEQIAGQLFGDGADGICTFTPSGTVPAGNYFYDAQAFDRNGERVTFAEGRYDVTQDITKI